MSSTKAAYKSSKSSSSKTSSSSSKLHLKPWYTPTLQEISPSLRSILENYSHIPSEEVISHILSIREKAYTHHPTPFLGLLTFTNPSLPLTPSYPQILHSLHSEGAKLLDIGCGLGQDLRSLYYAGAPSNSLYGIEISDKLLGLSYELFNDKESWRGKNVVCGDVFSSKDTKRFEGKFDFINLSLFLHLWGYEKQVEVLGRVVRMLKNESGVLVTGTLVGNVQAREVVSVVGAGGAKRRSWRHDVASFEEMWREVGERSGGKWAVWCWEEGNNGKEKEWDEEGTRGLRFEVKRA